MTLGKKFFFRGGVQGMNEVKRSAGDSTWGMLVASGISARRNLDLPGAANFFRLALEEAQYPDCGNCDWSRTQHSLALLLDVRGQRQKAEIYFARALACAKAATERDDWKVRLILDQMVDCLLAQEKYAEAEPLFLKALAIDEEHFGCQHWLLTGRLMKLERLYEKLKQPDKASAIKARLEILRVRTGSEPSFRLQASLDSRDRHLVPPPGKEP